MSARLQESAWSEYESPKYVSYTLCNFREILQIHNLPESKRFEIEVVGSVLPFKTNNYVIDNLIDWTSPLADPMFVLTFPQKGMLKHSHYHEISNALKNGYDKKILQSIANKIRLELNPHPAGQLEYNIPTLKDGTKLYGVQHKYKETVLFFPSQGQTCHAYCTFCFRWPQFVGIEELRFASNEILPLVQYLREHSEVTDVLFTGGDPLIMKTKLLSEYINPLLEAGLSNLRTIRIGSKALSYWPYRFLTDADSDDLLHLFEGVCKKGIHLALMAHFNHPIELSTRPVREAIRRIQKTGAQIRTQSPILAHINDEPKIWQEMWQKQVSLGCIPYYMFIVRDTGSQDFFSVPVVKAQEIFTSAYSQVSGLARTVRGPSMSTNPGKVQILGKIDIGKKKAILLKFLQGRNPQWVQVPFLAKYDENAIWLDDLKPFSGKKFFFEDDLNAMLGTSKNKKSTTKKRTKKTRILPSINNKKMRRFFEDRVGLYHWKIGGRNFS